MLANTRYIVQQIYNPMCCKCESTTCHAQSNGNRTHIHTKHKNTAEQRPHMLKTHHAQNQRRHTIVLRTPPITKLLHTNANHGNRIDNTFEQYATVEHNNRNNQKGANHSVDKQLRCICFNTNGIFDQRHPMLDMRAAKDVSMSTLTSNNKRLCRQNTTMHKRNTSGANKTH